MNAAGTDTIFTSVRIGKPCDDCEAKKILCIHEETATPAGLSRSKRNDFIQFYKNDEKMFRQEFVGETGDDSRTIFFEDWLDKLAQRKEYPVRSLIDMMLVSIDPANGGDCEWGLCACYYDTVDNVQVIVLSDAQHINPVTPSNVNAAMMYTFQRLRGLHPAFKDIPIVVACESAPKVIGEMLAEQIQFAINEGKINNVYMMTDAKGDRPGVPKDNMNTQDMIRYSQLLLQNDQVYFSEVFNTSVAGVTAEDAMKDLFVQAANVKRTRIESKNPNAIPKYKIDGKAGGRNDDRIVAWFMNYYHYFMFMQNPKKDYEDIRNLSRHWRGDVFVSLKGLEQGTLRQKRPLCDDPQIRFAADNDTNPYLFPFKVARPSGFPSITSVSNNNVYLPTSSATIDAILEL